MSRMRQQCLGQDYPRVQFEPWRVWLPHRLVFHLAGSLEGACSPDTVELLIELGRRALHGEPPAPLSLSEWDMAPGTVLVGPHAQAVLGLLVPAGGVSGIDDSDLAVVGSFRAGDPLTFLERSALTAPADTNGVVTLDAIDFLRRVVHVRQQLRLVQNQVVLAPPKGGRERDVPLPDVVSIALANHVGEFSTSGVVLPWREPGGEKRPVELLFTNRNRGPLTRAYFTHNAWKPALRAAGLERKRENGMHALRHHYTSVLLEKGVSIRAVSEYLGHHDPGFTLRTYAHLMPQSEDRARAAIDAALGSPAESSRNALPG